MVNITDEFIKKVLAILPEEGLKKLNAMIDDDNISEDSINTLLQEYNIDPKTIIEEIKKEGA